jgi:hypothetical protein
VRDAQLPQIVRVHCDDQIGHGLYEVRKMWHSLRREGFDVPWDREPCQF